MVLNEIGVRNVISKLKMFGAILAISVILISLVLIVYGIKLAYFSPYTETTHIVVGDRLFSSTHTYAGNPDGMFYTGAGGTMLFFTIGMLYYYLRDPKF